MPVHPTAIVDPAATVDPSATIGPFSVIEGPVHIGAECRIAASVVIMGHTEIGDRCQIHSHACIGDLPQDRAFHGQTSYVRIGDDCVFREGVTVHRGTDPDTATIIGDRCFLMTNSHVGHNCVLADDVTLISGALLGGYVDVGARAIISGNAAVHQFVRIGELAMISGLAKIVMDVPPFFMTDRDGAVVGVNRVGLSRAGFTPEEKAEIKTAYRMIYRSGSNRENMIAFLTSNLTTEAGLRVLAFMSQSSSRGVARKAVRKRSPV